MHKSADQQDEQSTARGEYCSYSQQQMRSLALYNKIWKQLQVSNMDYHMQSGPRVRHIQLSYLSLWLVTELIIIWQGHE